MCVFNSIIYCQIVLQSSHIYLHFHWRCITVPVYSHSCQYFVLLNFKIWQSNGVCVKLYVIIISNMCFHNYYGGLENTLVNSQACCAVIHSITMVVSEMLKILSFSIQSKDFQRNAYSSLLVDFSLATSVLCLSYMEKVEQALVNFEFWV